MDDCLIWTGRISAGKPVEYIDRVGRNPQRTILEGTLGRALSRYEWIATTCGDRLCVQPSHIALKTSPEYFWSRVQINQGDCWIWMGARNSDGYGEFTVDGRNVSAHRFAWESRVGTIPDGMVIDHLCSNRLCQNPDHMEPVTQAENARRGLLGRRIAICKNGHDQSVHRRTTSTGRRFCGACAAAAERRYRAKKKVIA